MYCTSIHYAAVGTCVVMGWDLCLSLVRVFGAAYMLRGRGRDQQRKRKRGLIQFKNPVGRSAKKRRPSSETTPLLHKNTFISPSQGSQEKLYTSDNVSYWKGCVNARVRSYGALGRGNTKCFLLLLVHKVQQLKH